MARFFTTVLVNKKLNWQMCTVRKVFYFLNLTLSKFLIYILKKEVSSNN